MQQFTSFEGVNLVRRQCNIHFRSNLTNLESASDTETRKKRSAALADQIDYSISSEDSDHAGTAL